VFQFTVLVVLKQCSCFHNAHIFGGKHLTVPVTVPEIGGDGIPKNVTVQNV